jgi:agmatine deiminase
MTWCRDHGAIFVSTNATNVWLQFPLQCVGWKAPFDAITRCRRKWPPWWAPVITVDVVLEGGSIDVNGAGVVLTTEQCLLNQNRNPTLRRVTRSGVVPISGCYQVLWLGDGIVGDGLMVTLTIWRALSPDEHHHGGRAESK